MTAQTPESRNTLVWYTAADGSVVQPNPLWQGFTGQDEAACAGWGWLDAVHPEDRAAVRQAWAEAVLDARPMTSRYRLRRRDGDYRHIEVQGAPVFERGRLTQWVGFAIDTTVDLEERTARRASEARLRVLDEIGQGTRQLVDAEDIMAVTARLLGQALGATRCAYADVDGDSDRFTIRSDWSLEGVPSSAGVYSLDLFGPEATSNLRQGRHLVVDDVDRQLGDEGGGRMFNAIGIKAIICAGLVKEGRLVAMMAVHQAAPREWTPDEVLLVSEVVDRCWAHIERARDAAMLKEQDARKDEFIATLAHELRNPLAPIKYAVAIASRQAIPEPVAAKLAVIDRQVSLMAKLIDDLLDVSRISRGLIELEREDTTVDALVAAALEGAHALLEKRGHRLVVQVPADVHVRVDPQRLVQVIGNLLANAAKYTPNGGCIEVRSHCSAGQVTLSVQDNGLGIGPADQGRLFTMFTQLAHTKTFAQGGLGLGLALVRKLVELHGGTVQVRSAGLGQGSTFSLQLPLVEAEAVLAPAALRQDGADARGRGLEGARVLVVEDNDDGRETLVELLRGMGLAVEAARTGLEALDVAARRVPDLVLLDLGLPDLDGLGVATALRQRHGPESMAIVALTGWGAAADRARTSAAGFDEHLAKPVEPALLVRTVVGALERIGSARA